MGQANPQLNDALKRLSAAKHGRPRATVEKEIFDRLGSAEKEKQARLDAMKKRQVGAPITPSSTPKSGGSSFLDDWLAKRQQLASNPPTKPGVTRTASSMPSMPQAAPQSQPVPVAQQEVVTPANMTNPVASEAFTAAQSTTAPQPSDNNEQPEKLQLRGDSHNANSEVAIKFQR